MREARAIDRSSRGWWVARQTADGAWIAGSEEKVRDVTAEMRRRLFEQAVQKRVDAAEAAFPPSALSNDGKATGG